jgi:peptide/nickel transport system ATP-binding protein
MTTARTGALLSVERLSVSLGGAHPKPILKDISFDLRESEVLGVIGESGSGKTILARALVNWLPPRVSATAGRIDYRGEDILRLSGARLRQIRGREIGYIGANPMSTLNPTVSVGRQIVEKLRAVRPDISERDAVERVLSLLGEVHIPSPKSRFNEYPFQFSGGMMQRALIVDALVSEPTFLIADNITQPLDVTVAAQILRLMRSLRDRLGTAIVFVSSSLPMVREIADEILVLHDGEMVERQAPDRLIAQPQHAYTRQLIDRIPRIWSGNAEDPKPAGDTAAVLRVEQVSKTYRVRRRASFAGHDAVRAVRNVSFEVREGENFGIVGESGCGKSTLSRLLTRLEQPDTGSIRFDGKDMAALSPRELLRLRRSFQLLLQDPYNALPARLPIGRIIAEALYVHGERRSAMVRERVLAAMAEVGLPAELYDRLTVGLSAGQRQRVSIARALVLEPKLLILDETLSALDQTEQTRLLALFDKLQQQHGFTYVFISHDLAMVRRTCARIAVMYLGEIVELADNRTLFFDPGHPYSRALLSAVPAIEPRPYDSESCLLEGEPPSPIAIPVGCSFASRCPLVFDRCRVESPALYDRGGGNKAACFLVEEGREQEGRVAEGQTRGRPAAERPPATAAC